MKLNLHKEIAYKKYYDAEIKPLESLKQNSIYKLRVKLNNKEKLSRDERNLLIKSLIESETMAVIEVDGWMFSFVDVAKWYVIEYYGAKKIVSAIDKTSIKASKFGVKNIIRVKEYFNK